jgi:peptidoglycan/xylan/chitin deacetylase (PgdA/CDA1 family)
MRSSLVRSLSLAFASALVLSAAACGSSSDDDSVDQGSEEAVGTKNMAASSFGLHDHELALTLDDGPGPRTVEIAEWLAQEKIPATFFMVGKNARANPQAVQRVVELSQQNDGLFFIGNHSMTHSATPLPRLGTDATIGEIMNADAILKDAINGAQKTLPSVVPFFRPPYGAFSALGAANIARINEAGAAKYTGPVFWDIGGELSHGYSADWACWGQRMSAEQCMQGYIAEATAKKRGIILAHDVHSKTVDMLTGKGTANGHSMIKELRAQGFTFVSLRAHEASVDNFGRGQEQLASNPDVVIDAQVNADVAGKVSLDVRVQGGSKVMIALDDATPVSRPPGAIHFDSDVAPGQHFITVTVLGAEGASVRQERYPFVAQAPIAPDSDEATSANCVAFDKLKAGQKLGIFHGKVACNAAGAVHVDGSADCYRFSGDLTASRDPELAGPREWSLDFDLTYAADPRDKSKLGLVIAADSGAADSGRRYWPGTTKTDVTVSVTSAQCDKGLFAGQFVYANGSTEDLLISLPRP